MKFCQSWESFYFLSRLSLKITAKVNYTWLSKWINPDYMTAQEMIKNETYDFSKSPSQFYLVKKHKCASSTFVKVMTTYVEGSRWVNFFTSNILLHVETCGLRFCSTFIRMFILRRRLSTLKFLPFSICCVY